MNRLFLSTLLAVLSTLALRALTPQEAFVTAPREVIVAIDSLTRLDMIDYYDAQSTVASRNAMGGEAMVTSITDSSITLNTSKSSQVTITLLPTRRDTVIMVINTLALPTPDSYMTLYNSRWEELPQKQQLRSHNDLTLWLLPVSKARQQDIENAIPFIPAIYTYNNGTLTVTHTLKRLLPVDEYDMVKDHLRPSLTYQFSPEKSSFNISPK